MIGIKTKKAPSYLSVTPYFLGSSLSFLILSFLFLLNYETIFFNYLQPDILAIVHTITLGIITMMIMGTLNQFIPVVFSTSLKFEKLAFYNFFLFYISLLSLIHAFYFHNYLSELPIAASLTSISIWIFIFNIIASFLDSVKYIFESKIIITALIWLFLTTIYGLIQAFSFKYPIVNSTINLLKIHIHFGLIGWLLMIIIGVSSIILPMFLISHRFVNKIFIKQSYFLINFGLIILWLAWQFNLINLFIYFGWGLISLGFMIYLIYIFQSFQFRKKKIDITMKHVILGFVTTLVPIIISLIIITNLLPQNLNYTLIIIYISSILIGVYLNLILGITYRTLPFIAWLFKFQSQLGKIKVPKPVDLFNNKIANFQFYSFVIMMILLFVGISIESSKLLRFSAIMMMISATLYNFNVFRILFKKH